MFSFSRLICLIVCVFQLVDDFNENSCSPFLFVSLRYSASWTGGEVEVATHCGLVPSKGALIHIGRRSLVKGAYSEMPCSYWDPELCHTCLFLFTYRHLQRSCRIRVKPYEATWEQTVGEMSGWGLDSFSCFFSNLLFLLWSFSQDIRFFHLFFCVRSSLPWMELENNRRNLRYYTCLLSTPQASWSITVHSKGHHYPPALLFHLCFHLFSPSCSTLLFDLFLLKVK